MILVVSTAYSQKSELLNIDKKLQKGKNDEAKNLLSKILTDDYNRNEKAYYFKLWAKYYENANFEDKAYQQYLKAKTLYIQSNDIDKAMDLNPDIAFLLMSQNNENNTYNKFVDEYLMFAVKSDNAEKLARAYGLKAMAQDYEGQYEKSLDNYKKALVFAKKSGNKKIESSINNNLAYLYNEALNKPDSGLYYLNADLKYIKQSGTVEDYYNNYRNQAAAYYFKANYAQSVNYLRKADSIPLRNYVLKSKQYIYEGFYKNYEALHDYKNAYKYLLLAKKFADSANAEDQDIAINEIQTKYQTKEKELENTKLKNKIATDRILLYSSIGVLLAVAAIAFLIIKNARRKEKISRQEKKIEQQKLEKALKDYELNSIDMMLEGQEKERQRIANDLHDNLGSMLATLKLNFENLKLRKNELRDEETKLYERTDELIEEAYQKVRRLAHAKNAGVFATEGLIPTIKKLAEKISIPGKLQIQVIPFGFSDRLENTLEIAIFRTIQELSTNIIKHSQATEATIHLTHHDDNINIIIEDNGIGFKSDDTQSADGMGLHTIRKKIEQLGGTFTIDSTPGKGTTIIIDIPI